MIDRTQREAQRNYEAQEEEATFPEVLARELALGQGPCEDSMPDSLLSLVDRAGKDLTDLAEAVELLCSADLHSLASPLAEALYWHCSDYHEGQGSERYRVLSSLDYSPGMSDRWPQCETAQEVYEALAPDPGQLPDPLSEVDYVDLSWLGHNGPCLLFRFQHGPTVLTFGQHACDALEAAVEYLSPDYFSEPDWENDWTPCSECQPATYGPEGTLEPCDSCYQAVTEGLTCLDKGRWIRSEEWSLNDVPEDLALSTALASVSFGAMQMEANYGAYWETEEGPVFCDDMSLEDLEEQGTEVDGRTVGVLWRLSMPGHLDATDWSSARTYAQAVLDCLSEEDYTQPVEDERTAEVETLQAVKDWEDKVTRSLKGVHFFGVGSSEDTCEKCREDGPEGHFSNSYCDSCGTGTGGDRYPAHGRIGGPDSEVNHFTVCTDCVQYHANGDLPTHLTDPA